MRHGARAPEEFHCTLQFEGLKCSNGPDMPPNPPKKPRLPPAGNTTSAAMLALSQIGNTS